MKIYSNYSIYLNSAFFSFAVYRKIYILTDIASKIPVLFINNATVNVNIA